MHTKKPLLPPPPSQLVILMGIGVPLFQATLFDLHVIFFLKGKSFGGRRDQLEYKVY